MDFSTQDLKQIKKHGLKIEDINQQLEDFSNGIPTMWLVRAATINDGIRLYDTKQTTELVKLYDDNKENYSITKFVPASGAATRMMKDFYTFLEQYKDEETTPIENFEQVKQAIDNLNKFAFYDLLSKGMKKEKLSIKDCLKNKDYKTIVEFIVTPRGLNYGKYPKAWITFHKDAEDKHLMTAFEQHLKEAGEYACSKGNANIHFTITKEHLEGFEELKKQLVPIYEKKYNLRYNITFSFQEHSTDTIAVNPDNTPFYDSKGELVFRPSGHGALIGNLEKIDSDIIFIKNIDNISSCYTRETIYNKELLGGVLIFTKQKVNTLMTKLKQTKLTKQDLVSIARTMTKHLGITEIMNHTEFPTLTAYKHYLREILSRPIRVCGMVKNTGEPGGGPYYVKRGDEISLQIVETAQMCLNSYKTKNIIKQSTHFNPVDLVVSTKDWQGNRFVLKKFIDNQAGFITEKTHEGKPIKAMERPGLWNGAMAKWITIFVEVPLETFSPVKTLNDLLKEEHQ